MLEGVDAIGACGGIKPIHRGEFGQPALHAPSGQDGDHVDRLCNQRAGHGDDDLLDQLLHAVQGTYGGARMQRADAAGMACAPCLEQIQCLGTAHLTNRDTIRPQAQGRAHQFGQGHDAVARTERDKVGRSTLQFARIFDQHDPVVGFSRPRPAGR